MPEGPEIVILSQYLLSKLKDTEIESIEIISGKYMRKPFENINLINKNKYKIINIDSKGKILWFELRNENNEIVYMTSQLGLTGFWEFEEKPNLRVKINIFDKDKRINLYYIDDINFGNIKIYEDKKKFDEKINELAVDSLKDNYNFSELVEKFIKKLKNKDKNIVDVLMNQKNKNGIVSGIGNYLMAEILYEAKISPFRTIKSLNNEEINKLGNAIKYITKLSYYNNTTGYMTEFGNFIKKHKKLIDEKIYPEFHNDIKLKKTDTFSFKVYGQKYDPFNNVVEIDKSIQGNRSTYYVSSLQL